MEARWAHSPKGASSNPPPVTNSPHLEPYIQALAQMSPANQQLVLNLIRGLAEKDNKPLAYTIGQGLQSLEEGIPPWLASLKVEQYSPRTIEAYHLIVKYYLRYDPHPTFLSIQKYLAYRLGEVSSARVATERKVLRSF